MAQRALGSRKQVRGVLGWGRGHGFTFPSQWLRQILGEPWDSSVGSPDLRAVGSPLPWSLQAELPMGPGWERESVSFPPTPRRAHMHPGSWPAPRKEQVRLRVG